jgi:hypothetical protein
MKRRWILACVLLTSACSGETYETGGDFAQGLAEAACARAERCDTLDGATVDECIDAVVDELCSESGVDCQDSLDDDLSDGEIERCLGDLEELSCAAGTAPASCSILD